MANIAHIYYILKDIPPMFTLDGLRILTSNSFISHEKAHRELGYSPRPLKETIADTIKWYRESGRL
jgi:dihydroflavonol-4-reductase